MADRTKLSGIEPDNREEQLRTIIRRPKRSLIKLSMPILIGMIVQAMYNIVDTAFIGRVGADAVAALTFSFPLFFLMFALNGGIGAGTGSRIARYLGSNNKKAAANTALHALGLTAVVSIVAAILGILFLGPLFSLLGASDTVLALAISYMSIVLYGMIFLMAGFVIASIFQAQGDTKTPMIVQGISFGLNIILDPIFIFVLDMGVKGAAIATVISFTTGTLISIFFLLTRSYIRIRPDAFHWSPSIIKEILKVGAPASVMFFFMSIFVMFLNKVVASFGTEYIAAFGIVWRLDSFAFLPVIALATSLMNIVGLLYGAKKYKIIKHLVFFSVKLSLMTTICIGSLFFLFPQIFLRIFTPDPVILAIGIPYIRIAILEIPFSATGMMVSRSMQGMGMGLPGLFTALARTILVTVPLAYLFVFVMGYGYLSVAAAMVIGSIVSMTIALTWFRVKVRHLLNGMSSAAKN